MSKAIEQLASGLTVGYAGLGLHADQTGTVRQMVHDGDTVIVRALGNLSVRFLGVDAPEISFTLPGERVFRSLGSPLWEQYLHNPFATSWETPLEPGLRAHLEARLGPGAALNHHRHAQAAEDELERAIERDISTLGQTRESFRFFLAFAHEVMDRYGRLLCYLNRDQPAAKDPEPRPRPYNERLLEAGRVGPYFIWPNVDPFRRQPSLEQAVIPPFQVRCFATGNNRLALARQWVAAARQQGLGIFQGADPLRLEPFEVRFLARRRPPDRWVIDLSRDDDVLIRPQAYFQIRNPEDRLYLPAEYLPLFVERGWRRQPS